MQYHFARWTITLVAQIRVLQDTLTSKDGEYLKRAVGVCEAELQELYRYAHDHHIDLMACYQPFAEIEQRLQQIHEYSGRQEY